MLKDITIEYKEKYSYLLIKEEDRNKYIGWKKVLQREYYE